MDVIFSSYAKAVSSSSSAFVRGLIYRLMPTKPSILLSVSRRATLVVESHQLYLLILPD